MIIQNKLKPTCNACKKHILRHKSCVSCNICSATYHPKCNNLKPGDVRLLGELGLLSTWTCTSCIGGILPVSYHVDLGSVDQCSGPPNRRQICYCCSKRGNKNGMVNCELCDKLSHLRCFSGPLGCRKCVQDIFPGFDVDAGELFFSDSQARYNDKIFNPFDRNSDINNIGNIDDGFSSFEELAWSPCSNILEQCKYYEMNNIAQSRTSELKILSLNIRSINDKIVSIRDDIDHYAKFDVLCFNETCCSIDRLPFGGKELELEPFYPPVVQSPARQSNRGGGLIIYVNRKLCSENDYKILATLSENNDFERGEFLFLEIARTRDKNIIIGNMYRSPSSNPELFLDVLQQKLELLKRHKNKIIVLASDSNIDLLKYDQYGLTNTLVNSLAEHGFVPVISRPTRITSHSATLIDHIFVNNIGAVTKTGIATIDLSDHLAPFVNILIDKEKSNIYEETRNWRQINDENLESFKKEILDTDWSFVTNIDSADEKYNIFELKYRKIYDKCFPKKSKTNRRKNDKPWILPWLQDACKRKNKVYKIYVKNPTIAQ